jgi:hypothetical protein
LLIGEANSKKMEARKAAERKHHERYGSFRGRGGGQAGQKRERPQLSTIEETSPTSSPWDMPSSAAAAGSFGPDGAFRSEDAEDPIAAMRKMDPIAAMRKAEKVPEEVSPEPLAKLSLAERPLVPWKSEESSEPLVTSPPIPSATGTGSRLRMFENLRSVAPPAQPIVEKPVEKHVGKPMEKHVEKPVENPMHVEKAVDAVQPTSFQMPFQPPSQHPMSPISPHQGGPRSPLPSGGMHMPMGQMPIQIPMPVLPGMPARPMMQPAKWVYQDNQGKLQGPFTHVEMEEWFQAGYFPPTLLIKTVDAAEFEPVQRLVERFGKTKPFLDDAEMRIRAIQMSIMHAMRPAGVPMSPAGVQMSSGGVPMSPGGVPMSPGMMPAMNPAMMANLDDRSKQMLAQQMMLQQQMMQMRYAMTMQAMQKESPPLGSAALSSTVSSPRVISPVVSPVVSPAVEPQVEHVDPVEPIDSWVEVEKEVPTSPERKAPWMSETTKPKLSLKEIQETEEKRKQEKQRKMAIDTTKASHQPSSLTTPGGTPWGSSANKKLSLQEIIADEEKREKARKAKEDAQRAQVMETLGTADWAGGKRFADAAATPPAPGLAWNAVVKPKMPVSSLPPKPTKPPVTPITPIDKDEDGWQVQTSKTPKYVLSFCRRD